jgi:hypothetical protein
MSARGHDALRRPGLIGGSLAAAAWHRLRRSHDGFSRNRATLDYALGAGLIVPAGA